VTVSFGTAPFVDSTILFKSISVEKAALFQKVLVLAVCGTSISRSGKWISGNPSASSASLEQRSLSPHPVLCRGV
jgi:hypothetical protein